MCGTVSASTFHNRREVTGGLLRCAPPAWLRGECSGPGKPKSRVCPVPGFLYPSYDLFAQCVIVGDGAAKVLERVDVLDLCAISGDVWRLRETFWRGLK